MDTFWQKQELSKPLFDDLLWSRPQQKALAGKLLIIGGNAHAIAAPGEAFALALQYGVGQAKVAMPDKTRKLLGKAVPTDIEFVDSTPSGSFSTKAEQQLKSYVAWADAVVFAGDIGRNSETAIVLEKLLDMPNNLVFTRDSADYFMDHPTPLLTRKNMLLVLSFAQLQKYAIKSNFKHAFTYDMGLVQLVQALYEFSLLSQGYIAVQYKGVILIAVRGKIISTKLTKEPEKWRLKVAVAMSVWWLQNPSKPLEAMATAVTQVSW